jgi:alpha-1,2-mannosyltransferase
VPVRTPARRRVVTALTILGGAVALAACVAAFTHFALDHRHLFGQIDVDVYVDGSRAALHGDPVYRQRFTSAHLVFIYPPFALAAFAPVTWLSDFGAHAVVWATALAALAATVALAVRDTAIPRRWQPAALLALLGLALWLEPVQETLKFGQVNLVLMALVAVDLTRRLGKLPRGVLTGIAAGIKLTPLIFVPYLWLTGRRREAGCALATFAATVVVGFAAFPSRSVEFWRHIALDPAVRYTYVANQSLRGAFNRVGASPDGYRILWTALALVVLAVGLLAAARWQRRNEWCGLLVCALTSLVVSPISWTHHWVWVAPGVAVLAGAAWRRPTVLRVGALVAGAAFFCSRVVWLAPKYPTAAHPWHGWQLLAGNAYLLAALAALGCAAVAATRLAPPGDGAARIGLGTSRPLTRRRTPWTSSASESSATAPRPPCAGQVPVSGS